MCKLYWNAHSCGHGRTPLPTLTVRCTYWYDNRHLRSRYPTDRMNERHTIRYNNNLASCAQESAQVMQDLGNLCSDCGTKEAAGGQTPGEQILVYGQKARSNLSKLTTGGGGIYDAKRCTERKWWCTVERGSVLTRKESMHAWRDKGIVAQRHDFLHTP